MSSLARILLLAASVTPALSFCGGHTHLDARAEGEVPIKDFAYAGTKGPLLWSNLEPGVNTACSTGTRQSPINMVEGTFTTIPGADIKLSLPDLPEGAEFENIGTTVEVVMEGKGGSLTMPDGSVRNLTNFHFHHPSEHLNASVSMPMEMHMVFSTEDGQIAVIGIYIEVLQNIYTYTVSPLLETVFASVDAIATPGTATTTGPLLLSEIANFIAGTSLQTYSGSLTTPPCSEEVAWHVATCTLAISLETFTRAREILGFNSRFPQNTPGSENLLALAQIPTAA